MRLMPRYVLCLFLIACGGDSDSPADKCSALVETVCGRAVECDIGFDGLAACVAEVKKSTDCSKAEGVGETYDACMDDLDAASCQALFPTTSSGRRVALPTTCTTAIE